MKSWTMLASNIFRWIFLSFFFFCPFNVSMNVLYVNIIFLK
jgi:hypothetical protein